MDKIVASAFSPCGRSVVSGSCDGTMRVWDATKAYQNAKASPHSGKTVSFVQWALTGNRIASFGKDNVVVLTDPATLTPIASWVMHSPVTSIAVNALCDRVAVGDAHGKVRLFRLERPTGHTDPYPVGTMTKLFSAEKCVHLQPLCVRFHLLTSYGYCGTQAHMGHQILVVMLLLWQSNRCKEAHRRHGGGCAGTNCDAGSAGSLLPGTCEPAVPYLY